MSPRRILIVYGTNHGQTARIARRMREQLTAAGDAVTLADASELPRDLTPRDFDGTIVGGSVNYGRHQRAVERFVRAQRDTLNAMPSAFFSVSGSAASPQATARAAAQRCVDEFLRDTRWRPVLSEIVAGTMAYTKYSPLVRWLVKRV